MPAADPSRRRPGAPVGRSWRRGAARRGAAVGVVALLGLAACSSGGGGSGDGAPEPASATTAPTVPAPPAPGPSGQGTVVVGGTARPFEVVECRLEPDPAEPEAARALLVVTGAGTTSRGDAFTVEVQRFAATLGETTTYTDTITYQDPARILQAQRVEVAGQVTDLRDPAATSPLLRPRADGVSGAGLAGPPGDTAEEGGLVGLALDATC